MDEGSSVTDSQMAQMRICSSNNIIDFEDGWTIVYKCIVKLRNKLEGVSMDELNIDEYMNIHLVAYKMCNQRLSHKYSQQLYDKYRESLVEYITLKVLPALSKEHDEFMLRELVKWWEHHKTVIRFLSNMLSGLDTVFTIKYGLPSLREVGFICFRELVYYDMRTNLKNEVIGMINREREGERVDPALLKEILDIFVEMGIDSMDSYINDFETHMLEDTEIYYSRKAALWISEDSCPEYLLKAEDCLKHEKDRVAHYVHSSTVQKLLERVQNELLSRYQTQLLDNEHSGCHVMLKDGKKNDLSRMYRLFCTIHKGLEPIINRFSQLITSQGTSLVKWAEDAINEKVDMMRYTGGIQEQYSFVYKVIELHDTFLDYVEHAFENNDCFHKALREAFEVICDKNVAGCTFAELLATFFDTVLKKGVSKTITDDHIQNTLEKVVKLVGYVHEKDLFSEFCRQKLAHRLLLSKNANENQERSLLSKLKLQYDVQVTSNMEGMLKDFAVVQETQAAFHDISKNKLRINFSVTLLNSAVWPTYEPSELNIPSEMVACVEVFKQFYSTQHQTRKVTWIFSLGTCDIISRFDLKIIGMTVTTYQAATLLLFNESESLSYEDIKSQLNLPDEEVERLLHSITCGKHKILVKQPDNKIISPSDRFEFNAAFTHKLARIKIPVPRMIEKKKVAKTVEKNRIPATEAAVVRIMKSRKVLHRRKLLSECVKQLEGIFKPDIKEIEKVIRDLKSRDFLERDKENRNLYRYVP